MDFKTLLVFLFWIIALPAISTGQDNPYALEDSLVIDIDVFGIEEPAVITLNYDMKEFQKRQSQDQYLEAELIYHMSDSLDDRHHDVRIKSRGKNRKEICAFPPIWINISKSDIKNKHLGDFKKMKLVTHCGGSAIYSNYVMAEYLAYKIYNLISPYSFRVRLVQMKYLDTGKRKREISSWAFLIEPEQMLADRLEMLAFKNDRVSIKTTNKQWTDLMSMFQYMIGNSDYSVVGRQNVKLLRDLDPAELRIIPVPYDFDYAGMVNAHYAVPGDNLGIRSVRERYFLGPCRTAEEHEEVLDILRAKKESIFELVNGFEYMPEKQRAGIIAYLEEFYTHSEMPRFIERDIQSTCRK
jgi:hypothetical protein